MIVREIPNITNEPKQQMVVFVSDTVQFTLYLEFFDLLQEWRMKVTYLGTPSVVTNLRPLVVSVNTLLEYRNILPFGINCSSQNDCDPFDIDDFVTKRIKLNTLDKEAVEQLNVAIYGNTTG